MTNAITNETAGGLATSYAEPTFATPMPIGLPTAMPACLGVASEQCETQSRMNAAAPLMHLVQLANTANTSRAAAEEELVRAGRAHLAYSCLVGACVQQVYQLASANGVSIKTLFKNYYKEGTKAVKLAGGCSFSFTYEHGNKCRKVYEGVRARMLQDGGYTPERLERVIGEHVQALIAGAYGDVDSLRLFGPFLTADSMRQELLNLFPPTPPTAGEKVSEEVANGQPLFTGWEAQRAHHKTEFLGFLSCIDTYIDQACMYTTDADREEQAQRLEQAARRLRAAHTQPDLPGLPE